MSLRSTGRSAMVLGLLLLGAARGRAQDPEPDPCASTRTHGALKLCWAREVERAEQDMDRALSAVLDTLPRERLEHMKKAQKEWGLYRDAHLRALYGDMRHDVELFTCTLIARRQLTRARTAQLERMLRDGGDESACPL